MKIFKITVSSHSHGLLKRVQMKIFNEHNKFFTLGGCVEILTELYKKFEPEKVDTYTDRFTQISINEKTAKYFYKLELKHNLSPSKILITLCMKYL